jgi:pyridoxal phosphate enzyme (YggS family)
MTGPEVADNVRRVQERIELAARRAGRDPAAVTLVAASKRKPAELIEAAVAAGVRAVGENYVQEAREKIARVREPASWHLIGRLQRNKARVAVELFDVIQTLDGVALARALDRLGHERGRPVRALVEVNLGGEASKSGIAPEGAGSFLDEVAALASLRIEGLMAIPPPGSETEARHHFRTLARLGERLGLRELSMGMSDDFEVAIEEGATFVRVGRALFGRR